MFSSSPFWLRENPLRLLRNNKCLNFKVTSKQLRRLFMNMKQRQRDILTIERQHRLATGGGPSMSNSDSALDPDISGITNNLLVCINGAIDSDTATELIVIDGNENQPIHPLSPDPTIPEIEIQTPIPIQSAPKSNDLPKTNFNKANILEYEYYDRKKRFDELHDIELRIMKEKLREAKARADLANLVYEKEKVVFSN